MSGIYFRFNYILKYMSMVMCGRFFHCFLQVSSQTSLYKGQRNKAAPPIYKIRGCKGGRMLGPFKVIGCSFGQSSDFQSGPRTVVAPPSFHPLNTPWESLFLLFPWKVVLK